MKPSQHLSIKAWVRSILLDWGKIQMAASFILILLIGLTPLVISSPYYMGIIILTIVYAIVGISWNIIAGFTGQSLIAHLIFFAFGAYTTIMLLNHLGISPWIGLIASAFTAALLGLFVSLITLRYGLKADYFALFTIALMVAFRPLFSKWKLAGGASGIYLRFKEVSFRDMIFIDKTPYLYIGVILLIIAVLIQYWIYVSKMGKYFLAIRENEDAAAALGVNTAQYKTFALLIGAAIAGVAGGFYVMYTTFIDPPQLFNLGVNVEIALVAPLIGGLGTLIGPIIGAIINKPVAELIRSLLTGQPAGISLVLYGLFLISFVLFLPKGIGGWIQQGPYQRFRRRLIAQNIKEQSMEELH